MLAPALSAVALLTLVSASLGQTEPVISIDSSVVTLTNRQLLLNCTVTGVENPTVYWADPRGFSYDGVSPGENFGFGHQRFSYEFSGNKYNLRISRVEAIDAGRFTCSVKRSTQYAGGHKRVQVTVYVKPENVIISGTPPVTTEFPPNVTIIPYNQERANITCTVGPSSPAVAIKWYKNGELVTHDVSTLPTIEHADGKVSTRSLLSLVQPRRELNNVMYTCKADVQALNIPGVDLQPMSQTFNLSVQYPPSSPLIEGYREGVTKQPGDTVVLMCKVHDGNPLPSLRWLKNGVPYYLDFHTEERTKVVTSRLVINITAADNQAEYKCEAKNAAIDEPYIATTTFEVQFPPEYVRITGQEEAKAGSTIILTCTSANSNPRTVLSWFYRGSSLPTADDATAVTAAEGGGFITQTNITVTLDRSHDKAQYSCHGVVQGLRKLAVDLIELSVLYPPQMISITGFNSTVPARMGLSHKMTCASVGGNPLPDLAWYKGDTLLDSEEDIVETGNMRSLDITFVAKPNDNEAVYSCRASSKATTTPMTAEKTVIVNFPPQDVRITTPSVIRADQSVSILCNSGSSNPQSVITWQKDEEDVSADHVEQVSVVNALWGGKETVSRYTFVPTAQDNGLLLHCNARNHIIKESTTGGVTLSIQHKPYFDDGVVTEVALMEGVNTTANFTAVSNPGVTTYEWFKVEGISERKLTFKTKRDGSSGELSAVDGLLTITHINRARAGLYRVKATNSEGVEQHDFTINVKYGASIRSTRQIYDDELSTLQLLCVVDANPIDEAQLKWTRLDYDTSRSSLSIAGTGNERIVTLTIVGVVREDIGTFTCEANNTHGIAHREYVVTPVKFAPVIDKSPSTSKAAAKTHNDGVIICRIFAFPQPTVSWYKGSIQITNSAKYLQTVANEGPIKFEFLLTVKNVSDRDYGTYRCDVNNDKGQDSHTIMLNGTSEPDPPYGITVEDVTDKSITIQWSPGFNGGLAQRFMVKYQKTALLGSNIYAYEDANQNNHTLTGLESRTEYYLTVQSINDLGKSPFQPVAVYARTQAFNDSNATAPPTGPAQGIQNDDTMLIVIMCLTIIGVLLFIMTAVLIFIFVRRRKRQKMSEATDSTSQSNTVEMFGTHDGSGFHDDAKSYSTYEKGLEFDDDYAKHYEDDGDIIKQGYPHGTYLTEDPIPIIQPPPQPWNKVEDPQGQYGAYTRKLAPRDAMLDDGYANELRNVSRSMPAQQVQESPRRPAFVAGRPAPPPPPGRRAEFPPSIPERNYSPIVDNYSTQIPQAGLFHASVGRSTPSVESTDDVRGHLV